MLFVPFLGAGLTPPERRGRAQGPSLHMKKAPYYKHRNAGVEAIGHLLHSVEIKRLGPDQRGSRMGIQELQSTILDLEDVYRLERVSIGAE